MLYACKLYGNRESKSVYQPNFISLTLHYSYLSHTLINYSPVTSRRVFDFCQDCPSYLASTKTVRDLFLPPVQDKSQEADLVRKPFISKDSLGKKHEIADSLGGSQI